MSSNGMLVEPLNSYSYDYEGKDISAFGSNFLDKQGGFISFVVYLFFKEYVVSVREFDKLNIVSWIRFFLVAELGMVILGHIVYLV